MLRLIPFDSKSIGLSNTQMLNQTIAHLPQKQGMFIPIFGCCLHFINLQVLDFGGVASYTPQRLRP
jgi:hypothetical protein